MSESNWLKDQSLAWYDWTKRTLLVIGAFTVLSFILANTSDIMKHRFRDVPVQGER